MSYSGYLLLWESPCSYFIHLSLSTKTSNEWTRDFFQQMDVCKLAFELNRVNWDLFNVFRLRTVSTEERKHILTGHDIWLAFHASHELLWYQSYSSVWKGRLALLKVEHHLRNSHIHNFMYFETETGSYHENVLFPKGVEEKSTFNPKECNENETSYVETTCGKILMKSLVIFPTRKVK